MKNLLHQRITPEQAEAIATLARLELTDREKNMYAEQLSVILEYMDILNEVDTTDVPETSQVTGLEDVVREDAVEGCEEEVRRALLEAFPEREGELLRVKGVFEEQE
ncbi:MAG: hypothetical protein A3C90_03775 [Candidatus Magasanikbacteria bacterium RIFCSPHIGHO2_02_FULL_51_14]|uniref:Aspartyl/glutamyl-tRNA(Asn/Gln) amidotransferase subunit C n=1 Tax=Candidatus Magasanikbacteria bacterium RIFCSPHIGHO2_02_FULL_51_14 TaxID=1798683 RepID=A0A1F6MPG7_9BACT|nr:MAG: hypothetical protein A3C90_03775 [Candidatus Magasanikbacteria bacterium RIFCSPHIGHO2_02_FULL_51_14]